MGPLGDETDRLLRYLIKVCPSSLETKSDQGYTPLFLACLLGRVQFAKTLIDAGADQSVTDRNYMNIVHASVTNGPKLEKVRELLNLLDPDLRSHLFLQRSRLSHGGDTPLHFWLKNTSIDVNHHSQRHVWRRHDQPEDENSVKILKLLLEFSGGADLGILNGSGDTVLHSAVARQLPKHMQVILDENPKFLYCENAVGRTPAETAFDHYIATKVARPKDVAIGRHVYHNKDSWATKPPLGFVNMGSSDKEPLRVERVWQVAQEYLGKFPAKRRLVSLNEANEVARRLGESYSSQRYYPKTKTTNEGDEEPEKNEEEEPESDFVTAQYASKKGSAWNDEKSEND